MNTRTMVIMLLCVSLFGFIIFTANHWRHLNRKQVGQKYPAVENFSSNNPQQNNHPEDDLALQKRLGELEAELAPKFNVLMQSMQKMLAGNKPPSDEATRLRYTKIMQLMMGANQIMQTSQQVSDKYRLRLMEVVRDMVNEAYDHGKAVDLVTEIGEECEL